MKLYELRITEFDGEREHSYSLLLAADNKKHAKRIAVGYIKDFWGDPEDCVTVAPDLFEFLDGEITVKLDSLLQTTFRAWADYQLSIFAIGDIPSELLEIN